MNLSDFHRFVRDQRFLSRFRRLDQRLGARAADLPG